MIWKLYTTIATVTDNETKICLQLVLASQRNLDIQWSILFARLNSRQINLHPDIKTFTLLPFDKNSNIQSHLNSQISNEEHKVAFF